MLADLQNGMLAAILTFSYREIYPAYATVPGTQNGSTLEDQAIAGVIMWAPGSMAFLLPAIWLVMMAMTPGRPGAAVAVGRLERQDGR